MGVSFTVQVLGSEGEPAEGIEVEAHFPSWPAGTVTSEERTDSDGQASFETVGDHDEVTLYVEGEKHGPYDLSDGDSFTVNL